MDDDTMFRSNGLANLKCQFESNFLDHFFRPEMAIWHQNGITLICICTKKRGSILLSHHPVPVKLSVTY